MRFTDHKAAAGEYMAAHAAWIKQGVADGVFLLAGSLQPGLGGVPLAHNSTAEQLRQRVEEDPFVAEKIVDVEILEVAPGLTDERLAFLQVVQAG
ncbi:hypothetical protein Daura_22420 [Dactylosporangium aurantiacum]|uniref:YCII-related domain-containing protein n=1 Tax=Dactylosporangium aurantiacum TaxID=35754 RepID=A0A9Q9IUB7_9ACTN|nr:hypothetical protein Daura_22420 [Dactylosporangium aurantiacum]